MSRMCPQCGAPASDTAVNCEYCGAAIAPAATTPVAPSSTVVQPQVVYVQPDARANWPIKNKLAAALLALLLGGIGAHKFYLGQGGLGILFILFCWTGIPAILGLIEGILMLASNDENFQIKYKCRLG